MTTKTLSPRIRTFAPGVFELSWMAPIPKCWSNAGIRNQREYARETRVTRLADQKGAERFARKHGVRMPRGRIGSS
jgi:hypothetical protein